MPLPTSRERTYVNGIVAIPDDINAIQDAIIAAKHGSVPDWMYPAPVLTSGSGPITGSYLNGVTAPAGTRWASAFPFAEGSQIVNAKVRFKGAGTELGSGIPFEIDLLVCRGGSIVSLGGITYLGASSAWQTLDLEMTVSVPYTLLAGESLCWDVQHGDANERIAAFGVTRRRL